jgi:hypothetical protein
MRSLLDPIFEFMAPCFASIRALALSPFSNDQARAA